MAVAEEEVVDADDAHIVVVVVASCGVVVVVAVASCSLLVGKHRSVAHVVVVDLRDRHTWEVAAAVVVVVAQAA